MYCPDLVLLGTTSVESPTNGLPVCTLENAMNPRFMPLDWLCLSRYDSYPLGSSVALSPVGRISTFLVLGFSLRVLMTSLRNPLCLLNAAYGPNSTWYL